MRGFSLFGCLVFLACTDAEATARDPSSDSAVIDQDSSPSDSALSDSSPTDSSVDSSACTVPAGQKCTTAPLCGCAPDENCAPLSDGTFSCAKAGASGEGAPCTAAECAKGLVCVHYYADATLKGSCQAYCQTAADCPARTWSWRCSAEATAFKICHANCDLRFACGSGGCIPVKKPGTTTNESVTECVAVGTGKGPGTCPKGQLECAPGYGCIKTSSSDPGSCVQWCGVSVGGGCPSGTTCRPLTSPPIVVDGTEYGVCVP